MDALGRSDADKELDEWLQNNDKEYHGNIFNGSVGQVLAHVDRVDNHTNK